MSSTSPQPLPQIPPIESLAPPLPDARAAVVSQASEPKPESKNESWVTVEMHGGAENASQTNASSDSSNTNTATVKIATAADPSSTLFSRVMKQRATSLPQTPHIQKDNTLAIFVTLCLVVVAIACGIYFVADRETQNQGADHASSALVQGDVAANVAPPSSLFGKPIAKTKTQKKGSTATVATPKLSKADQLIQQSQTQLSSMQYIEAEYSARRATELKPASGDAWLALGRALYSEGRYSYAERAFKTCIKHDVHSKAASSAADFLSQMPALGQTK